MSDPLICLRDVSKHYTKGRNRVPIFDGLDLDIARADFVAVMGPSGSGKTTLLNIIGGIDRTSSGTVTFDGHRIDAFSERMFAKWRAANVGFIFQFYNLMPMLTAAQNVELPLLLTHLPKGKRREHVARVLDLVGLGDRAKHLPKELSGGQQQRVAIARALVTDPPLILADEPTGDLDRATADEVLSILDLLSKELGKTVVMVTHDPSAAARAGRLLRLDKGVFVEGQLLQ
jgi:putative ABC transport system ATP-binding protein